MRHGIILAKSIPAKKYHIQTGESIMEALQKCPKLKLVPPNYGLYEKCSSAFMELTVSGTRFMSGGISREKRSVDYEKVTVE